jgi:hypothetical protein
MWFDRLPDENNHGLTPESLPKVSTPHALALIKGVVMPI